MEFALDSCAVTQLLAALDSLKLGPLYLEKIGLTTQHTSAVNHLLQQQHTRLQGISLFGNPLTTTFLEGVSDSLRQCSRLEQVHFGDCGLSSACLPVLAPLLRHWPRHQKLWLSNNDFRDLPDDADQFLDSVHTCRSLSKLGFPTQGLVHPELVSKLEAMSGRRQKVLFVSRSI